MVRQKKEYIHSMGEWDNFLSYFKKEISKLEPLQRAAFKFLYHIAPYHQ